MGALLLSRGPPGQPHSRAGRGGDAEGWGQSLTKILKIQFYYKIENKSKDRGQEKRPEYVSDDNRN